MHRPRNLPIRCFTHRIAHAQRASSLLGVLPLLLLATAGSISAQLLPQSDAALQQSAEAPRLVEGALLSPDRELVVLMTPGGEIEAIDAESGEVRWLSPDAARPLGFFGEYLVAQRESEQLEVVFLELSSGAFADELTIALPSGTSARIDDSAHRRFEPRLRIFGGAPLVTWTETRRYSKGVPPAPGEPMETSASRAYSVDLTTMSSSQVPVTSIVASRPPSSAASAWLSRTPSANAPITAGSVEFAVFFGEGRRDVYLKTWELGTGRAIAETRIHSGEFTAFDASVDGRHVAVVEEVDTGRYEWSLFDSATGQAVGGFEADHSFAPFSVSGETVLFPLEPFAELTPSGRRTTPRRVRAQSLRTGAVLWERPLRQTRYSGPRPH
ncbi:MAG: hypothetical protein AAGK22_30060 [Acidobacteriota bacterium]